MLPTISEILTALCLVFSITNLRRFRSWLALLAQAACHWRDRLDTMHLKRLEDNLDSVLVEGK
jgi:hypothetical protein